MIDRIRAVDTRVVVFYDDELDAVRAEDGQIYVSIRKMCDALGLDSQGQTQRIRRHEILADGERVCELHTQNYKRDNFMLRTDLVPLWLSGIRAKAVKEAIRPKLERFQKEAAKVLWEAFQEGRLTTPIDDLIRDDTSLTQAERALQIAHAVFQMARNQVLIERRIDGITERLTTVEELLGDPGRHITPEQAMQISQAVQAIGVTLSHRSGRVEFGAIYGELYRRYGITSYKLLPASRFEETMQFLTDWHASLHDDVDF